MLQTLGLLVGGIGLVWAMISDLRRFIIPDSVHGLLLLGFALMAIGVALPWQEGAIRLGVGVLAFLVALLPFARGWLGGGDVKLLSVCLLWVSPWQSVDFLLVMALVGAGLALVWLIWHAARGGRGGRSPLPYSLAIAAAWAVCVLPLHAGGD